MQVIIRILFSFHFHESIRDKVDLYLTFNQTVPIKFNLGQGRKMQVIIGRKAIKNAMLLVATNLPCYTFSWKGQKIWMRLSEILKCSVQTNYRAKAIQNLAL